MFKKIFSAADNRKETFLKLLLSQSFFTLKLLYKLH